MYFINIFNLIKKVNYASNYFNTFILIKNCLLQQNAPCTLVKENFYISKFFKTYKHIYYSFFCKVINSVEYFHLRTSHKRVCLRIYVYVFFKFNNSVTVLLHSSLPSHAFTHVYRCHRSLSIINYSL